MTTQDDPIGRAEAIFEALNASELEEEAAEDESVEDKARRLERIREWHDMQD